MSVLDDLAAKLVADGVGVMGTGTYAANAIYLSSAAVIPAGAGPQITLSETGGVAPTRIQNKGAVATIRPTVQVLVRATSYAVARAKSLAAYQSLDGNFNATINGNFYLSIMARQEPTDMAQTAGSALIVFNLDIEKAPS